MKIREIVDRILDYHPHLEGYKGCDDYKCGDPDIECTGVVTALTPNITVIRKAIELRRLGHDRTALKVSLYKLGHLVIKKYVRLALDYSRFLLRLSIHRDIILADSFFLYATPEQYRSKH